MNHKASILRRSLLTMLSVSGAATLPEYASAADALEEVIVTAQRREQSMQDVPVAVTAFSEEALKVNRITDVYDLGSMVPNLTVYGNGRWYWDRQLRDARHSRPGSSCGAGQVGGCLY